MRNNGHVVDDPGGETHMGGAPGALSLGINHAVHPDPLQSGTVQFVGGAGDDEGHAQAL